MRSLLAAMVRGWLGGWGVERVWTGCWGWGWRGDGLLEVSKHASPDLVWLHQISHQHLHSNNFDLTFSPSLLNWIFAGMNVAN